MEVAQVLGRYAERRELSETRAHDALQLMAVFPITRYPQEPLLERIWKLRQNLTAYDAAYVALSQGLRATPMTRDRKLARAAKHLATVEIV